MRIISASNADSLAVLAADILAAQVLMKPNAVLGLATGSTPVGTYQQLIQRVRESRADFSGLCAVNLDEYVNLPASHSQSYALFMRENLFSHINILASNTHIPDGMAKDIQKECEQYDELIERLGGIDLQLLGIGVNGHIGFNEPSDEFVRPTHRVTLTESTRNANSRFFSSPDEVPTHAITMGLGAIFAARHVLMLAIGAEKAQIVKDAFFGPITPAVPASILQLHPNFTLITDAQAASLI